MDNDPDSDGMANSGVAAEFNALPAELVAEFRLAGTIRSFRKNSVVIVEGEPAEALYVVVDGEVLVYVDDESGKLIELCRLGAGQYFGELILGSAVRTASIRTLLPTRLCLVSRRDVERVIAARPQYAFLLIQNLIARIKDLTASVRSLALMDVYGRVARLLLESAEDVSGRQIVKHMSQQAIADRVGASRSMINRIMQDLEAGGYIAATRGSIELKRVLPKRW